MTTLEKAKEKFEKIIEELHETADMAELRLEQSRTADNSMFIGHQNYYRKVLERISHAMTIYGIIFNDDEKYFDDSMKLIKRYQALIG